MSDSSSSVWCTFLVLGLYRIARGILREFKPLQLCQRFLCITVTSIIAKEAEALEDQIPGYDSPCLPPIHRVVYPRTILRYVWRSKITGLTLEPVSQTYTLRQFRRFVILIWAHNAAIYDKNEDKPKVYPGRIMRSMVGLDLLWRSCLREHSGVSTT